MPAIASQSVLYNSLSLCISDATPCRCLLFVVLCFIAPSSSCRLPSSPHIFPTCTSLCTCSHFSFFLYCDCLFLLLFNTSLSLAPPHSAPTHLLSELIFILSCSSTFALFMSHYLHFISFHLFSLHLFQPLSHLSQHVEIGLTQCQKRRGDKEPFLHSIHMSCGEEMVGGRNVQLYFTQLKHCYWQNNLHHTTESFGDKQFKYSNKLGL